MLQIAPMTTGLTTNVWRSPIVSKITVQLIPSGYFFWIAFRVILVYFLTQITIRVPLLIHNARELVVSFPPEVWIISSFILRQIKQVFAKSLDRWEVFGIDKGVRWDYFKIITLGQSSICNRYRSRIHCQEKLLRDVTSAKAILQGKVKFVSR